MADLCKIDKQKLINLINDQINADLVVMNQAAKAAHEAATHEESKAEDGHDTRGLEASYLAGAQAKRAVELETQIGANKTIPLTMLAESETIRLGALVELTSNGKKSVYFLTGESGGIILNVDGLPINIISTKSPLGQALIASQQGDWIEVQTKGVTKEYEILSVV